MWEHGGNIYWAAAESQRDVGDILDFSANINPLGLPGPIREAVVEALNTVLNYPQPGNPELVSAIASYLGVKEEYIIPGNGATEIIFLTARAIKPCRALVVVPAFSEYERALQSVGCRVEYHFLRDDDLFSLDVASMLSRLYRGYQLIVLCNPNNPTGTLVEGETLQLMVDKARDMGIYVMVDEAFIDFLEDQHKYSLVSDIGKYDNLVVVRAFTKFFGMPGLRLGYGVVSGPKLKEAMLSIKEPWSVNALAEAAGIAALGDDGYIRETRAWINRERDFLYRSLDGIGGLKPFKSDANFILVKILRPDLNARILQQLMLQRGILIRDASNFKGLDDRFIRVAVKGRGANVRMIEALKEIMN